jgi:hypothetical protein
MAGMEPDLLKRLTEEVNAAGSKGKSLENLDPEVESNLRDKAQDRTLRRMYAVWFVWILIVQLALMNAVFVLVGRPGWLRYDNVTLDIFVSGTLAEVFGIVVIITKNLFPRK